MQYTTGCTFGKGNIEKRPLGKLALTLIDKATNRAVRVSYKPTLQKQISASPFMQKRAAGVPPTEIPEEEKQYPVDLIWNAPQDDILTIGPVFEYRWSEPEEVIRFAVCARCVELVAESYLRVAHGKPLCKDCAGYAV